MRIITGKLSGILHTMSPLHAKTSKRQAAATTKREQAYSAALCPTPMRHLPLFAALIALAPATATAKPATIQCPGETTPEMRYCAEQSWKQSDAQLREKVSAELMQQWQDATRALCAAAYAPYKNGTIYPQLVVGCDDQLNRALLKEFRGLGEPQEAPTGLPTSQHR